jgi:5-methylcytosine-specific restriction endonuclease McrA
VTLFLDFVRARRVNEAKNCALGRGCGQTCIERQDICRLGSKEARASAQRLLKSSTNKLKKGAPKVQYITSGEARLMRVVADSKSSLLDIASGRARHPLYNTNLRVTDRQVGLTLARIKSQDKNLYNRISSAGIRKQGSAVAPKKDTKAFIFTKAYLMQNGRDFYTGKPLNLRLAVLDHIVPLSKGGTNTQGNLVLTSRNINFYKKALDQQGLKEALRVKTDSLDPKFGDRMRKALSAKDPAEALKLQKAASAAIRDAGRNSDKAQAKALRDGRAEKLALSQAFKDGRFLLYGNSALISLLPPKAIKELQREQHAQGMGVYTWFRSKTTSGTQVQALTNDAGKAIALIQSGGGRADVPKPWLQALRLAIENNAHAVGNKNLAASLGPEFKDLF